MSNLTYLHLAAREIFDEALRGVNPYDAVCAAIHLNGAELMICDARLELRNNRRIYSIAIGKAAMPMTTAVDEILGNRLAAGIISTNAEYRTARGGALRFNNARHHVFAGGHPVPNEQSLAAAEACFDLLKRAEQERALIIFLISGGGSAMLECPIDQDITVADLRTANKALVDCGASISEINTVRRAFSAVKGGRLAAHAPRCDQITLIVSDVPTGQEYNVASGPTLSPPDGILSAPEIIARYDLRSTLPESVLRAVDSAQAVPKFTNDNSVLRKQFVLLDNNSAVQAAAQAARERGFAVEIAADISDEPIAAGCAQLVDRLKQASERADLPSSGVCLVSGGEFSCPVRGNGIGGRNLETALRLACSTNLSLSGSENFVALCAGTDGIDGNSPAAGAVVDSTTMARAGAIGLDASEFLKRSDSYSFFVALGDVITTGPIGTNVRDLRILLRHRSR